MTAAKPLRVGIVGCGNVAANHALAYRAVPDVDLVGCCDTDQARAQRFARRHSIPAAARSIGDLLEAGLDVVSVCTPHPTHEEMVRSAAAAGVHVLCEKPIAVSLDAARRMVDACASARVTLGVVFQRRFWPAAQRVRRAIDDGTVGCPVLGRCTVLLHRNVAYYTADAWRGTWATDGGGVLMTQGIHYVDLLQWYMGPAAEVSARYGTFVHGGVIEVEDTLVATVTFASGGFATITASTALTPSLGTQVMVTGRNGATVSVAEFPEGAEALNDIWAVPGAVSFQSPYSGDGSDPSLSDINARLAPFHTVQVADFIDAVRAGTPPAVTGREAMKSLGILGAIYESARTGRPAAVPEALYREEDVV